MTSSTEAPSSTDRLLSELVDRGFRFMHPRNPEGHVVAVIGVRAHHNVIDVVWLRGEDDVVASRMPGEETNYLTPSRITWRSAGTAAEVLSELVGLPDDRTPGSLLVHHAVAS
ncbi:hypothetical protein [Kutzneria buriramensis]|uniref:Uncharacterized protein n=1 Tax=Kutzneria buriramensis TaxID=1045776 RepID=A0A3E0HG19_9PSEU|nr:hypothetical protein [Kutzneria buriramensis]REH44671.1 hypothetical protein BCF44_108151 [Kutzneria buriramensis]